MAIGNYPIQTKFDLVILGGGSAAFAAAIRAAELGANVAVAEGDVIGGTCVNRGCLPTKNLLHAAELYHLYHQTSFPGVPVGEMPAGFSEVISQKDELVEVMRKQKYWDMLGYYPSIQYFPSKAQFVSKNEVRIENDIIKTDKFIIATGASPAIPPIEGLADVDYLTYKESLDLKQLPESLIVIGGGAIGLELGQMFSRFGSEVTILEMLPYIAPIEDEEISQALKLYLEKEGISVYNNAKVQKARQENGKVFITAQIDGVEREFTAEKLLVATGLRPNTKDLNLEAVGVELERGAIKVDEGMRTTAKNIWAAGDVCGMPMLVTTAAYAGGIAAENALRNAKKKLDYSSLPHAIFTDPQVASVGLKEKEAKEKGKKVQTTSLPFHHVPKAGAIRDTRGLIKMVVDAKSYEVLGVHLVSPQAADLIHIGVLAVKHKLTVGDLVRTIFVYPTLAEAFKIAAISFKKDVSKLSCCAS